mgnify:CR=1 FL=1
MATLDDDDRRYMEALLVEPIRKLNDAVFGEDGRGGLTQEVAEARGFAKIGAGLLGVIATAMGFIGFNWPHK